MEGSGVGYDYCGMEEEEEGYRTPTHEGCRIPAAECPPAPKRKRVCMKKKRKMGQKPKDDYFRHPDIDLLFKMMSTREPYIQPCLEKGPAAGSTCY